MTVRSVQRLLTSLALVLALGAPAQAANAHLAACDLTQGGFPNGGTTSSFNSTGATEMVVGLVFNDGTTATLSDSQSNTWVALNDPTAKTSHARLWHVTAPVTSASHTLTVTGTSVFAAVAVVCFSGSAPSAAVDVQSTNADDNVTSILPGSITPTAAGEVVVTVLGHPTGDTPTINGGFSTPLSTPLSGGNNYGVALAYLIQTTATAANPTWSWTTTGSPTTAIASFKAAVGAGSNQSRLLLGCCK